MANARLWALDGQSFSLSYFVRVAMDFTAILVDLLTWHSVDSAIISLYACSVYAFASFLSKCYYFPLFKGLFINYTVSHY